MYIASEEIELAGNQYLDIWDGNKIAADTYTNHQLKRYIFLWTGAWKDYKSYKDKLSGSVINNLNIEGKTVVVWRESEDNHYQSIILHNRLRGYSGSLVTDEGCRIKYTAVDYLPEDVFGIAEKAGAIDFCLLAERFPLRELGNTAFVTSFEGSLRCHRFIPTTELLDYIAQNKCVIIYTSKDYLGRGCVVVVGTYKLEVLSNEFSMLVKNIVASNQILYTDNNP
jgi:hypothetical protein